MPAKNTNAMLIEISVTFQWDFLGAGMLVEFKCIT
jgi:hypothetical protein